MTYVKVPRRWDLQCINHHKSLYMDYEIGRSMAKFSDLTLVSVEGDEFPAHKFVLSARSPVFDRMFASDHFVEAKNSRVVIADISSEVMRCFLAYLYSGDINLVPYFAVELLEIAHKVCSGSKDPGLRILKPKFWVSKF